MRLQRLTNPKNDLFESACPELGIVRKCRPMEHDDEDMAFFRSI
jgi:hypothetical protein